MIAGEDPSDDRSVVVWRIELDTPDRVNQHLVSDLVPDELERLRRLGESEVARRWLASRAVLRRILAQELDVPPAEVKLQVGEHGRPTIDRRVHDGDLDFNLSHSDGLGVVVAAWGPRIGVDVERLRRRRDPLRLAERYFSAAEVAALRAFPETDRPAAFFRYWTAKEALAKGLGLGLQAPWEELELAQQPGGTMVPVHLGGEWRLLELPDLPSGYCGALAVDDPEARIVARDWSFTSASRAIDGDGRT